jgi:phytoene desaturase
MSHVVVIGAGFAGLAAATALAARGHQVTIVEAGSQAGGAARRVEARGATVDLGPTILTDLGPLHALAAAAGIALDDIAAIEPLDPGFVAIFPGGVQLALHRDPQRMAADLRQLGLRSERDWARVLDLGARALRLAEHYWSHGDVAGPRDLARFVLAGGVGLADLAPFARGGALARLLDGLVRTPELRALLAHFARFLGLDAVRAPAVTLCIPYLMATSGVWYPRGGATALAQALLALATKLGVAVETDTAVERLHFAGDRVAAVVTSSGRRLPADACVAAVDARLTAGWLWSANGASPIRQRAHAMDRGLARLAPALAARVAWWVVEGEPPLRAHHAFHFDATGAEPLYVAMPTVTDPTLAPPGTSAIHALVHGPAGPPATAELAASVRARLERAGQWPGGRVLASGVAGGAHSCYGYAIGPGLFASFRPSQRVAGVPNLVRAGASVFPGPGIANVVRSGLRAAALVADQVRP